MHPLALDRRALMRSAVLLVGGTLAGVPDLAFAQGKPAFFTPAERATLDAACEAMIPKTDTPGALEAGVPGFIDAMMSNWANSITQAQFRSVVTELGPHMANASPAEQATRLAAFDTAKLKTWDKSYMRFKELVLTGYYLSEAGATQELRYELSPGVWEPATPVTADTRAWAV